MGRRNRRRCCLRAAPQRGVEHRPLAPPRNPFLTRIGRRTLLASTALASTFVLGLVAPPPAEAETITVNRTRINNETVNNSTKINTGPIGIPAEIDNDTIFRTIDRFLPNLSLVVIGGTRTQTGNIYGTRLLENNVTITNSGDIDPLIGIEGSIYNYDVYYSQFALIAAANADDIASDFTQTAKAVQTNTIDNNVVIRNSGDVVASYGGILGFITNYYVGLENEAQLYIANGVTVGLGNIGGDLTQTAKADQTNVLANNITIENTGDVDPEIGVGAAIDNVYLYLGNYADASVASGVSAGLFSGNDVVQVSDADQSNVLTNRLTIQNSGDIDADFRGLIGEIYNYEAEMLNVSGSYIASGIEVGDDLSQQARTNQANTISNAVTIVNSGDIDPDIGIAAAAVNLDSDLVNVSYALMANGVNIGGHVTQQVNITQSNTVTNDIAISNSSRVRASKLGIAAGIYNNDLDFENVARAIVTNGIGLSIGGRLTQSGNVTQTNTLTNRIAIQNTGDVEAGDVGIYALIESTDIEFNNDVDFRAYHGPFLGNVSQSATVNQTNVIESNITITNSGRVRGGKVGVYAAIPDADYYVCDCAGVYLSSGGPVIINQTTKVDSSINIINTGDISAKSLFAIDTVGASTTITNKSGGVITGFIDLTDKSDLFDNQDGGRFEARLTSDFGGGSDRFKNQAGGVLHAAGGGGRETTSLVDLEQFKNVGLISTSDGEAGDTLIIANTPGERDLEFMASGDSTLAVDAFLAGPGSFADHVFIEGDVSGKTKLHIFNTNRGAATRDTTPIPIVFVDGDVDSSAFFLESPVDTGFFDYDLFFRPTGSGVFELKQHVGGGAHILPHVVTLTHDTFHQSTETWFDQSTDLRVLLARGEACDSSGRPQDVQRCQQLYDFTPGVWVRGAGSWFEQDDTAVTKANGRTYRYDLARDLDVAVFESGIDFGKRDLFADGDILVFGVLGGAVHATLDYQNLVRTFNLEGIEAGAYATYLNGGLFVDTLFKTLFTELDPKEVRGFPDTLDNVTYGFRTDTGYRFGGVGYGPFIEPLATIAVSWGELDDFAIGGNAVNFESDEDVRGRIGLRLGTSSNIWNGTTMEPFVIGSLWGNLSGSHHATLTSGGTVFEFADEPEDLWGQVSAGVNLFNPGAQTSVFAKVDYTFADDTNGVGVRGGMRYNW